MENDDGFYTDEEIKKLFIEISKDFKNLLKKRKFDLLIHDKFLSKYCIIKQHKNLYWHMEGFPEAYEALQSDMEYIGEILMKLVKRRAKSAGRK